MKIAPGYVQPGGPPLGGGDVGGGGAACGAVGANLLPQGPRRQSLDPWAAKLEAEGRDPASHRIRSSMSCLVTDDRERDWGKVRVAERRRMDIYHRFREAGGTAASRHRRADRIPQTWVVGDVEHCVKEPLAFIRA